MGVASISFSSLVLLGVLLFVGYAVILTAYRLYVSPLARFPGPKLAAATLWYEFYYDVILRGQYTFHIKELHEQYGPIIRINPYELHVVDPEFYEILYATSASGEKRNKWDWYTKQFATHESMFSTVTHDQHKLRRAALNRFFSMASVRRLQPLLEDNVNRLLERFREAKSSGVIIPLEHAFAALTNDIVTEYAYGESDNRLGAPNWGPEYHDAVVEAGIGGSVLKQMFWIFHFMQSLPEAVQAIISPSMALVLGLRKRVEGIIISIKSQPNSSYRQNTHPTLFHELLLNETLPESEKTVLRLLEEALIVVAAGTVTTSWTLSVASYHLLASPRILAKLKAELREAFPSGQLHPPLAQLEQLPYLTGIIREALRLSYGVSSRLQRISPDKPMVYKSPGGESWMIPPGTPVGMTSVLIHHNESIFPDSHSFVPERWLENPRIEKYLVAFSKGSRQCIGINLAYAELYVTLAAVFRRYGSPGLRASEESVPNDDEGVFELYETSIKDVELQADGFVPLRAEGSKGIRIQIKS